MDILRPLIESSDNRRKLKNLFKEDIKDVNYYEAKRSSRLGNHYHKNTTEYFYIVKGSGLLKVGDVETVITKGDLFKVYPNERHTIECLSDMNFLTFLTEPFDESNPDLYR